MLCWLERESLAALTSNKDLVGEWFFSWAKMHGSLAWCALLLFRCVLSDAGGQPEPR